MTGHPLSDSYRQIPEDEDARAVTQHFHFHPNIIAAVARALHACRTRRRDAAKKEKP